MKWPVVALLCLGCGTAINVKTTIPMMGTAVPVEVSVVVPVAKRTAAPRAKAIIHDGGETVLFDYDSAVIRQDQLSTLGATEKGQDFTVTGHCDERGTVEYNLALGQRRADSVKAWLVRMGVNADRVQTGTMGKEAPVTHGRDEESWKFNRRAVVDFTWRE